MNACAHESLELLPSVDRVRCVRCHLTISIEELGEDCCPECFEEAGIEHRDFEPVADPEPGVVRYRCESCGVIIESS